MRLSLPQRPAGTAEVTAVIPCYNYGRYLADAVSSVLTQEGVLARVIIVDDCSTDDSMDVVRRLAQSDSRISYIAHAVNEGHIKTYNDGLAAVETDYVLLLSADDLLAPGALGRATALMDRHTTVGMVYGAPIEFPDIPPTTDRVGMAPETWTVWGGHEWARISCFRGRCFILSPEVVMRTDVVRQIGGYNSELPKSGDLEYWLRTAARWDVGRVNGRVQAYYRQHGANMHNMTLPAMAADVQHRLMAFSYLAGPEFAEHSDRGARLLESARKGLSRESLILATRELDAGGRIDTAEALQSVAVEIWPASARSRRAQKFAQRLRRAQRGGHPTRWQQVAETNRTFLNRLRWKLYAHTGIS